MNDRFPSLERYLRTRGGQLLGHSLWRSSLNIQAGVGAIFLAASAALAGSTLFGTPTDLLPASLAFLFPGVINLSVALSLKRRHIPETPVEVSLTPDAKTLLLDVYRQIVGWPGSFSWDGTGPRAVFLMGPRRFAGRRMRRRLRHGGFGEPLPEPSDEVLQRLNQAAAEHNRIAAALASAKSSPSISKLASRVASAADEAMAEIFDHAATLCRYPEGADAGRSQIAARTTALSEMADRLESLAAPGSSLTSEGTFSRVDGVLEDLRLEQLARSELRLDATDSANQGTSERE